MAEWYAGAVIYRWRGDILEFLVIDTRSIHPSFKGRSKWQTKFSGGTEDGHRDEDKHVIGTRDRELFEETHLRIRPGYNPVVVHTETMPGHFKVFYLIPFEELLGDIRTTMKTIDFDEMKPPYWVDRHTMAHVLYRSHQSAFMRSLERVSRAV